LLIAWRWPKSIALLPEVFGEKPRLDDSLDLVVVHSLLSLRRPLGGAGALLGAVIVIEPSLVAIQVILNEWYHSRLHCTARRSGLLPPRALPSHLERSKTRRGRA